MKKSKDSKADHGTFSSNKTHAAIKSILKSISRLWPFMTSQGRGRKKAKRYLSLFKCLLLCTVHLEMAYTLYTDSFLKEFCHMTSHRGFPQEVMSDNGKNFAGATQNLKN